MNGLLNKIKDVLTKDNLWCKYLILNHKTKKPPAVRDVVETLFELFKRNLALNKA